MGKIRQFKRRAWQALLERSSAKTACTLLNAKVRSKGKKVHFSYEEQRDLYKATDQSGSVFFSERLRGFGFYFSGLTERGTQLAKTYFIDTVEFQPDDIVIDCGANYADLYQYFKSVEPAVNYISFEPSPREHECILLNAPDMQNNNIALSDNIGEFDFYVSSRGGNSSLVEPKDDHTEIVTVKTETLDHYLNSNNIGKVKLLKLEAEGLEPEILNGAIETLGRIEYIAVDGGAERGLKEESTIEALSNHLISNGFEMMKLDFRTGMGRALFRNKQAN